MEGAVGETSGTGMAFAAAIAAEKTVSPLLAGILSAAAACARSTKSTHLATPSR